MAKNTKKIFTKNNAQIEFLSWEGSLTRWEFWKIYFPLMFASFLSYTFAPFIRPLFYSWFLYSIFVFTAILIIFQLIKRLRSTENSPWICLLLFVPFANLYVLYLLFLKK